MKIIKRSAFVSLPANTLYAEYEHCFFGPLMIKGETLQGRNDWLDQTIASAIVSHGDDFADTLMRATETGESISMDFDCEGRDGTFDSDDKLYAVWEPQDVVKLVNRLKRCLSTESSV